MAKTITLSPEVRDVLERSTITEDRVVLPEQLERSLYMKVAKILKAAGGKWDRKQGATMFSTDPREALGLALETGGIENEQQVRQTFYTPPELALWVIEAACITPSSRVLEPSAGKGALCTAAREAGTDNIVAIENDPEGLRELQAQWTECDSRGDVLERDFLEMKVEWIGQFDAVVMNPPFSDGQEARHVLHAIKFVKPGGRLVSIMSSAINFRNDGPYRTLRNRLAGMDWEVDDLPSESFKTSGTRVETVLVTVRF